MDSLFDISHAKCDELIKNKEDLQFLQLPRKSMTGSFGVRNFLQKRSGQPSVRIDLKNARQSSQRETETDLHAEKGRKVGGDTTDDESEDDVIATQPATRKCVISVSAVLDRTNTSVRKSTMIIASDVRAE